MDINSYVLLNNSRKIPRLGFGTWELYGEEAYKAVSFALKCGIRHIDTASMYRNEEEVGRAIRDSGIPREKIFVTSKVWNDEQGYESTFKAYEASISRLGLDYLDMYMVHWPVRGSRLDTYRAIESLYKQGRVKSIGVCNYLVEHLEEVLELSDTIPAINQIELHPFDYGLRKPLIDFCGEHKIQVEAYRPLAKASKNDNPTLREISSKYNVSVTQLLIRWGLQKGFVLIPRSSNPDHIRQNTDVYNFDITRQDMVALDSLNEDLLLTGYKPEDFL